MVTPNIIDDWKIQVRALMSGHRWCVACGKVNIPGSAPHYVVRCEKCYRDFMDTQGKGKMMLVVLRNDGIVPKMGEYQLPAAGMSKYCRKCGNQLENDRVRHALQLSSGKKECLSCLPCSRGWTVPVRGLFIPNFWRDYIDQIFPVAQ